jgi:hypothetical protein
MIVPSYQARIMAFTKNIPNIESLAKINVLVAPNQELANQIIAAIHTGNLRRRWGPERQAVFFQAQIDAGRTFDQLKERYPTNDVAFFVFRAHIFNALRGVQYDNPDLTDFFTTNRWRKSASTLARIYQSRDFLDLTGFTMDDKGVVRKSISDSDFKAVATIIIQGLKDNELNTRTIGTVKSARFTRLISELKEAIGPESREPDQDTSGSSKSRSGRPSGPGGSASGSRNEDADGSGADNSSGRSNSQGGQSSGQSKQEEPTKKPKPKKEKLKYLSAGTLVVPNQYPVALELHIQELSILDIQRFPNTAFVMLRAVLEKSIKAYAEAKGIDIKSSGNNTKGYVQLHHSLMWLEEYFQASGPQPLVQPVKRIRTGTLVNYTSSNDALNAINHNHNFFVDSDEVISFWNSIESVMRELMVP